MLPQFRRRSWLAPLSALFVVAPLAAQQMSDSPPGPVLVGPPAPQSNALCVEKRYVNDGLGPAGGVYWRIALSPRAEEFRRHWEQRQVRRGLMGPIAPHSDNGPAGPGGPRGCPETAEVFVVASHIDRGELLLADLDCDGVYEPDDLALFATALAGPNQPTGGSPLCKPTDQDTDGDTDLADVATMQALGGPAVPTRLDYAVDAGPWTALFGDADLVPGGPSDTFDWTGGGATLALRARAAYPGFAGGWYSQGVASDDAVRAIVLTDGADLALTLQQKQAQPAFPGQPELATLLAPWLSGGIVTLPAEEFLVLFELNAADPASPAFDFQDLVLRVRSECAAGSEVVLRDSIGSGNSSTNNNWVFSNTQTSSYMFIPTAIMAGDSLTLSDFRVISGGLLGSVNYAGYDFTLRVWSSLSALQASPTLGDVLNYTYDNPTTGPTDFGVVRYFGAGGFTTSYNLSFDLLPRNITISSGQTLYVGVQFWTSSTAANGVASIPETWEAQQSDIRYGNSLPGGSEIIDLHPNSLWTGRMAFAVRGITN